MDASSALRRAAALYQSEAREQSISKLQVPAKRASCVTLEGIRFSGAAGLKFVLVAAAIAGRRSHSDNCGII